MSINQRIRVLVDAEFDIVTDAKKNSKKF